MFLYKRRLAIRQLSRAGIDTVASGQHKVANE